ncbi:MAG: AIM24 family protein, partial [Planifilum fulgidum]
MYSVYSNDRLFAVVDLMEGIEGSRFELLEYKEVKKSGTPLRQIRIVLNEGEARSAEGALQFFKGNLAVKTKPGKGGTASEILRKAMTGILANESLVKQPLMLPVYSGEGEIYLKPSFHHYQLLWMEREEIIVDENVFFACDATISVSPVRIKLPASDGKEDKVLLQAKLSGTGACVLQLPVSPQEIMC